MDKIFDDEMIDSTQVIADSTFYDHVASAADFYFFQDVGPGRYEEHYFNPDSVLLFPGARRLIWFSLSHVTIGKWGGLPARRHVPWDLQRKKFAFSYPDNHFSVLEYSLLHSRIQNGFGFRPLKGTVRYLRSHRYERLCEFTPEGQRDPKEWASLDEAWRTNRKMKVAVQMDHSILIFDVRIVFRQDGVYSFSSKMVAIPDPQAAEFSWAKASIGSVCVSSDGTCSIYREDKPRNPFKHLIATCFPGLVEYAHRIFVPSPYPWEERIRSGLRWGLGPLLKRYVAPFEVEYSKRTFTVFALKENGQGWQ